MKFGSSLLLTFGFVAVFLLLFGCPGVVGGAAELQPVSNLKATAMQAGIKLTWGPSPSVDVAGYNIYRSNAAGQLGGKINAALVNDVSYTDTGVQDGTTYYYTVRAVNTKGTEEQNLNQVSATAFTAPPSGLSISINNGANFTASASVTLSLYAASAAQCSLSNDGANWAGWDPYSVQKTWILNPGDGVKTVYFKCRNAANVESGVVNASIRLKTSGPAVSILSPQQGDTFTVNFNLVFLVSDAEGSVTCNANADGAAVPIGAVAVGQNKTLPLILTDGGHALYVECTDAIGTSRSQTMNFETEQHPVTLQINDGSGSTSSHSVTLHVHGASASVCRYSNDGGTYSDWQAYAAEVSWSLSSGDGQKNVYLQCNNKYGVLIGSASDTITVDTSPLYVSLSINNGDTTTTTQTVKVSLSTSPMAKECQFSDNGYNFGAWQAYEPTDWYTLPSGDGTKTIYVKCRNDAGVIGTTSASIKLQQNPPAVPTDLSILINGGDRYTESRDVDLTVAAYGARECHFRNENGNWGDWQDYAHRTSWRLSSGDGTKTVYYQCRNNYGTSSSVHANIVLDTQPSGPTITVKEPKDGKMYNNDLINLAFLVNEAGVDSVTCTYYCNGMSIHAGEVDVGRVQTRTLLSTGRPMPGQCGVPNPGSEFWTSVECTDNAGNYGSSGTVTFTWTKWVGPLKEEADNGLLGGAS